MYSNLENLLFLTIHAYSEWNKVKFFWKNVQNLCEMPKYRKDIYEMGLPKPMYITCSNFQDFHNITVYEPCNYASNVAYFHVVTQICAHKPLWFLPYDHVKALLQGIVLCSHADMRA